MTDFLWEWIRFTALILWYHNYRTLDRILRIVLFAESEFLCLGSTSSRKKKVDSDVGTITRSGILINPMER